MTTLSFYELQKKRIVSDLGLDPFSWYKQMRMTDPVAISEQGQLCELFRYKDVQAVLADPMLFSSKGLLTGEEESGRGSFIAIDPPLHDKLRALASQTFTPSSVVQLSDKIRDIANELLDVTNTSDTLEVMQDFALPLSMRVITGILGIPLERRADLVRWVMGLASTTPQEAVGNWQALENYMGTLLVQKRQERQDDLISTLLDAQVDGELLSERELVNFCVLLLAAGFETTVCLISNAILCLDEHPAARAQLWADLSLLPNTLEEVLRFRPVVQRVTRRVTTDTEIDGKPVGKGSLIFNWVASANRDEEQWRDPEVFDIRRSPNPHLGFGSGLHACLGAPLVRLEARIALEQLIERFKDIQRVQGVPLKLIPSFNFYVLQQLPVQLQKR